MFIECTSYKVFLVRPKSELITINGFFDGDRFYRRFIILPPVFQCYNGAFGDALNIRYDELGERHGILVVPEEIKFLLHPCDGGGIGILPNHLIVGGKGALGFVNAADKGSLCAVGIGNDTRFAVHEAVDFIGQDFYLQLARG